MSTYFPAKFIAEEALRKVGAYAITDAGADPEQVRVALNWMDLIMAHVAATSLLWAMVPTEPILIDLVVANAPAGQTGLGQQAYPLPASISGNAPVNSYGFPLEAWLDHGDGNVTPLRILRKDEWDAVAARTIPVPSPQTTITGWIDQNTPPGTQTSIAVDSFAGWPSSGTYFIQVQGSEYSERMLVTAGDGTDAWTVSRGQFGDQPQQFSPGALVYLVNSSGAVITVAQPYPGDPEAIFIDRLDPPTLYTFPTCNVMPTQRVIRLSCQTVGPAISAGTVAGSGLTAKAATQRVNALKASWQRWLIWETGIECGSGTIRKLPKDELDDIKAMAGRLWSELMAFENDQFESLPLRTGSADEFLFGDSDADHRHRRGHDSYW